MGSAGNMVGDANGYSLGTSVDINFDGTVIVAGAPGADGNLVDNGVAKVFAWNDATSSWSQRGADVSGERHGNRAGSSVTINGAGTVFALGSWENDDAFTNAGQYQIFAWNETTSAWAQRGNDLEGPGGNSGKTASFSYDGSVIAIGSHYYNSGVGRVDIYQWDSVSGTWVPRGSPLSSGTATHPQPQSGWAVDLSHDGTTVVYTSPYETVSGSSTYQGTARVLRWDGLAWVAKGLPIETQLSTYKFGTAVSINTDGTVVAVTNFVDQFAGESSGHVAVYEWVEVASAWVQRGSDIACTTGSVAEDRMGLALNGDGSLLSIGEPTSASNDGRVRVFHWDGSAWTQRGATITPSSGEKALGRSVALSSSGNVMAVGAPLADNGRVRAFRWSTPSPPPPAPPSPPAGPGFQWGYGALGQNCNEICADKGGCNVHDTLFSDIPSLTWLQADMQTNVPLAFGFSCGTYITGSSTTTAPYTVQGTSYCVGSGRQYFECDVSGSSNQRMCPCGDSLAFVPPP